MTDERAGGHRYERDVGRGPRRERDYERTGTPTRISLIYESKDGRFCLFEDAEGHITAVPADRLA